MQYDNLILDDLDFSKGFSVDDKKYLEEFVQLKLFALCNTKISALDKLPDLKELKRVLYAYCITQLLQIELNNNGLNGDQIKYLAKYADLHTVKFAGNNVTDYAQLDALVSMIKR